MQQQVERVVSRRLLAVAENRVVEQIARRRERTIEAALAVGPPIRVLQDQAQVLGGGGMHAWIAQNQLPAVEHEAGAEAVGVRDDTQQRQTAGYDPPPARLPLASGCDVRTRG
ncbi:MAG: hypothetical protein QM736_09715 [Vicinamibacterales bacterium]